ncbi:MAG: FeoA domain-containing protein [Thermoanaerobacteraceae bacterium]
MEWLKILKEDILRFLREKDDNTSTFNEITLESKLEKEDVVKALKSLENDDYIKISKESVCLTSQGKLKSQEIFEKHTFIENVYNHQIAHALEHYDTNDLKVAFEDVSSPLKLNNFNQNDTGFIVKLSIDNPMILSRLIGLGLAPGSYFKIIKKRSDLLVIESHRRLIVLDKKIGDNIEGVLKDESFISRTA